MTIGTRAWQLVSSRAAARCWVWPLLLLCMRPSCHSGDHVDDGDGISDDDSGAGGGDDVQHPRNLISSQRPSIPSPNNKGSCQKRISMLIILPSLGLSLAQSNLSIKSFIISNLLHCVSCPLGVAIGLFFIQNALVMFLWRWLVVSDLVKCCWS